MPGRLHSGKKFWKNAPLCVQLAKMCSEELKSKIGNYLCTPKILTNKGLNETDGVVVSGFDSYLLNFTPLKKGDIVTHIDLEPVKSVYDVISLLKNKRAGDEISISVVRHTQILETSTLKFKLILKSQGFDKRLVNVFRAAEKFCYRLGVHNLMQNLSKRASKNSWGTTVQKAADYVFTKSAVVAKIMSNAARSASDKKNRGKNIGRKKE
eukprot:GHVL01007139.1.p2 GENE.GHVL01007139.1~~GHVL01007139.1.p2  ORF type:complete len:210 (+),score=35.40 GHVL01007139.1:773-1402(+)